MSVIKKHVNDIRQTFQAYVRSSIFTGIIAPGHFYSYCMAMEKPHINAALVERCPCSISLLAQEAGLRFARQAANSKTQLQRQKLLDIAMKFYELDEGASIRKSTKHNYQNLIRYIDLDIIEHLVRKQLDSSTVPQWGRNDGKKLLRQFALSDCDTIADFINEIRNGGKRLKEQKFNHSRTRGVIYLSETNLNAARRGNVVVKIGRTENLAARVRALPGYREGCEVRHWHCNDIVSAENEALSAISKDKIQQPFNCGKTARARSQEFYEIPTTHFNYISEMVKKIVQSYNSAKK
jgi:hypothetical protein